VWGGGWLWDIGVQDFAGGIVVHLTASVGGLVTAAYLGPRRDSLTLEHPPSNLPLASLGATFLWIGWFGFNGGAALRFDSIAVTAMVIP